MNCRHIALGLILLCTGCAQQVSVVSEFPTPLVEPLDMKVAVRFPEELGQFVHVEDPLLDTEWTIRAGEANLAMFRATFTGMFNQVIELPPGAPGSDLGSIDTDVDLVIEPSLRELEFTLPQQSGTDQFVVWLRYELLLRQADGKQLGIWRVVGYGQEDEGSMGLGDEDAMRDAAITALRDTSANIVTTFKSAPGMRPLLNAKIGVAEDDPAATEPTELQATPANSNTEENDASASEDLTAENYAPS